MASIFEKIGSALGLDNTNSAASAASGTTNGSTGAALSLQVSNNASISGAQQVFIAAPGGATIDAGGSHPALIVGNTGTDHLTGGKGADVIIGGPGTNVLSGGGGVDVFGHVAGATDYITDFSPAAGEKIALAHGLSLTGTVHTVIDPSTIGVSGSPASPAEVLHFSDGSSVTLLGITEAPSAGWFL